MDKIDFEHVVAWIASSGVIGSRKVGAAEAAALVGVAPDDWPGVVNRASREILNRQGFSVPDSPKDLDAPLSGTETRALRLAVSALNAQADLADVEVLLHDVRDEMQSAKREERKGMREELKELLAMRGGIQKRVDALILKFEHEQRQRERAGKSNKKGGGNFIVEMTGG